MNLMFRRRLFVMVMLFCVLIAGTVWASAPVVVFEDDFESSFDQWETTWEQTDQQVVSGDYSVRTSAGAGANGVLTMKDGIDTRNADEILVQFWLRQNYTEKNDDIFMNIYADGTLVETIDLWNANELTWRKYAFIYKKSGVNASGNMFVEDLKIEFQAQDLIFGGWYYTYPERIYLDDFSITTVTDKTPFLPSTHGFKFSNGFTGDFFPRHPVLSDFWDMLPLPGSSGSFGLCAGMAYAALDFYDLNIAIPDIYDAPDEGDLYDHIWYRQYDAWGGGADLTSDLTQWLSGYPISDPQSDMGRIAVWMYDMDTVQTLQETYDILEDVQDRIDDGELLPLLLLLMPNMESWSNLPYDVIHNHSVLCYDYETYDSTPLILDLKIYDSNAPLNDNVVLRIQYNSDKTAIESIGHYRLSDTLVNGVPQPYSSYGGCYGFFIHNYFLENDITLIPDDM